jgi:hypothetical protein
MPGALTTVTKGEYDLMVARLVEEHEAREAALARLEAGRG